MRKIYDIGHAGEQEQDEIRALLRNANIDFYETPSSGKTLGAAWVKTEDEYLKAQNVIASFTKEKVQASRREYDTQLKNKFGGSVTKWLIYNLTKDKRATFIGLGVVVFLIIYWLVYLSSRFR